jgi:hypothetical protein
MLTREDSSNMELATIATVIGLITPATIAAGWAFRRVGAMRRTINALEQAVDLHDAKARGVVLVITAPTMPEHLSAGPLLRERGWTICEHRPGACDGDTFVPAGDAWLGDARAADVVLVQGYPEQEAAALARHRPFRDALGSSAVVVLFAPSAGVRYDFSAWGPYVQGVTTALTADMWVAQAIHRRREIARLRGVRPGGLAAARATLPGV